MKSSINIKSLFVRIVGLLLFFNINVLANNFYNEVSTETSIENPSALESTSVALNETVEVSLDSFSNMGILIMIALSSLLGAFFVKDEFSEMLEKNF